MTRSFAEIASSKKRRGKGCPRCGVDKSAGALGLTLQALGSDGRIDSGGRITSRSISMCESCCVEVYEMLHDTLVREAKYV